MSLKAYETPVDVTEGEWVGLDKSKTKFLCRTPSTYNREYTREYLSNLTANVSEDGRVQLNAADYVSMVFAQKEAFAKTCIMDCSDKSVNLKSLFDEYPAVVDELFRKCNGRAAEIADEAEEAEKKPKDS